MTELAAHELTQTRDCRWPGCLVAANPRYTRGYQAGYCDEHASMRGRQVAARNGHAEPAAPPIRAPKRPPASLKEAAQRLVPAASKLDQALLRRRTARDGAQQAFEVFKAALEEVQQAAKDALA